MRGYAGFGTAILLAPLYAVLWGPAAGVPVLLLLTPLRYHGRRTLGLNIGVGLVSGVMKGATGMSGPPVILYLLTGPEAARQHRANLILFFGVISVVAVAVPLAAGLVTASALIKLALLLPVMLLSVRIGARLFGVVPDRFYRPFALASLVCVGLLALLA